jgi:hypothetical protein
MNPSKTLKNAVFALVVVSATAGSFTASAESQSVTVSIPSVGTVVNSTYKVAKKLLPYLGALGYFAYAEPRVKDKVADEGLQSGTKKLLECFVGIWFLDRVKNDAKLVDEVIFGTIDRTVSPTA